MELFHERLDVHRVRHVEAARKVLVGEMVAADRATAGHGVEVLCDALLGS